MIPRYSTKQMVEIWAEERKFDLWLKIELLVLEARKNLGEITPEVFRRIEAQAKFNIARIDEIEKELDHDLLSFVQCVQENLDPDIRGEFHRKMTSYDTEEIPTVIRIIDSLDIIGGELDQLQSAICNKAAEYRDTLMIGKTHGQHAEPITFGLRLLGWVDIIRRDIDRLLQVRKEISVGKLSGAVGVYGELDPRIEEHVCQKLNLLPARHSTQILHRDRIAHVMSVLAILAGNIEHIALNFRKMADTDIMEVREPFGKKQKGSSKMPHKKNTIITERLCGLARNMRSFMLVAHENIPTWEERDISQSGPERIILPDGFNLAHYMVQKLAFVLKRMEIFPDNMKANFEKTQGCVFSGSVKDLFIGWGMDPEVAYRLVQEKSFEAMSRKMHLMALLMNESIVHDFLTEERRSELSACFDPWKGLKHRDTIFARFGR